MLLLWMINMDGNEVAKWWECGEGGWEIVRCFAGVSVRVS